MNLVNLKNSLTDQQNELKKILDRLESNRNYELSNAEVIQLHNVHDSLKCYIWDINYALDSILIQ